ncbi:Uu.00g019290.m01.CDS01 [Anthostomella pinea]|uniref:Anaphase-promoting complex subunit 2 n=1 Tax=Anthostomella pinea TaxID=933095 RepID=A0AAI8VZT6_9PEZI|nr:Uu.00g019290.m01.CDS01 [Anthostomella pinea]
MADTKWNARRRRAIQSVFPTDISQPTPYSTPSLGFTEQGQHFGGPPPLMVRTPKKKWNFSTSGVSTATATVAAVPSQLMSSPDHHHTHAAQQTRFDRSWHVVTSRIALPPSVTAEDSFGPLPTESQDLGDDDNGIFAGALRDVLHPATRLPLAAHTDDLLTWHIQQVRQHFVSHVLPLLSVCDGHADQTQVVLGSMRTLEAAHRQYLKFRRDLHAIVGNSMSKSLMNALRLVLGQLMRTVLGIKHPNHRTTRGQPTSSSDKDVDESKTELLQLVESLCNVGLAGERFQILFAELLDGMMVSYVRESFAGMWEPNKDVDMEPLYPGHVQGAQPQCIKELSSWIENQYSRLAVEVTAKLGTLRVSWQDVEKWKEIGIGRLAALRISELFDIVISWPSSEGGIEDLRFAVTTPQRRLQLTDAFSTALQSRLLHPGRSTLEILRTYIAMVRTFHKLDHSRVLLDRVAYSLQLYLCTREDTVRTIVSGLLSTPKEVNTDARKTKLVELVELLYDPNQYRSERQDEEWDDLTWIPPPVDAGSNYKRRKSEDVIGTLIGALGSPEVFIKEFQNIIGERLLSEQVSFEQEEGVLDLLKKRFGESSLQACDVMIKDIQDSRRLDGVIHRGAINHPEKVNRDWTIHARILSRLYWPEVGEDRFHLPSTVAEMQNMYETIFEHLKPTRKIKWLNHLGQATVELELEDRNILEEVHTYEAAVINAFSEENAASWTFEDLWIKLEMDEDLLTAALSFWEKKRVLRKLPDGRYVVIERLSDAEQASHTNVMASSSAAAPADAPATPRKAKAGISGREKEKRTVYWQFIIGMLTNASSTMPLGQIAMMMKMLIADGFPWSNEELQEFLGEKVGEGHLEIIGGKYKLIKK